MSNAGIDAQTAYAYGKGMVPVAIRDLVRYSGDVLDSVQDTVLLCQSREFKAREPEENPPEKPPQILASMFNENDWPSGRVSSEIKPIVGHVWPVEPEDEESVEKLKGSVLEILVSVMQFEEACQKFMKENRHEPPEQVHLDLAEAVSRKDWPKGALPFALRVRILDVAFAIRLEHEDEYVKIASRVRTIVLRVKEFNGSEASGADAQQQIHDKTHGPAKVVQLCRSLQGAQMSLDQPRLVIRILRDAVYEGFCHEEVTSTIAVLCTRSNSEIN